jgi:PAS domain S-box-containing protein
MSELFGASQNKALHLIEPAVYNSEKSIYHMLMQAPAAITVFSGSAYTIEFANELYLHTTGKHLQEIINRPAFEAIPVAEESLRQIVGDLSGTGKPFRQQEYETTIKRNGCEETVFLDIIYQPLKETNGSATRIMVMLTEITSQVISRRIKDAETAFLQTMQNQLSLSVSAGNIGTWYWDAKNDLLTWNKEQYKIFGVKESEFSGRRADFLKFVLPEDLPVLHQQGEFSKKSPGELSYQFRVRRQDGEIRWLQARSRSFYNELGELTSITGVNIDITEQKRTEDDLKLSEQRFGAAVAAVQGILWTNNARGEMEGEQKGWSMLTGQSYEAYQGYGWATALHPDDAQPTIDAWNKAVEAKEMFLFEHRLKRKDGSWGRFSVRAVPVFKADGSIREWVGVHTDITEQRKMEESLRESEQRFRTLAETLPQLVWMTDEKGSYEYASRQWLEYAGLDPKLESTWKEIVHPEDMAPMMQQWQRSLQTGEVYRTEARLRNRDGLYRWHFVQGEPLQNEEGRIVRWIGAFTDIHDQKTLAQKLEKLVSERTMELHRSNEDLLQFAHVASHDLKEPVRKIRTFGSRLMHDFGKELPANAKLYLHKMESAAERMYTMIDGVLTYSTLNAMQQANESVNLTDLMQNITTDLEVLIAEKSASITFDHLPAITGSPILLYQLFYNLINNSLKFVAPGVAPVIRISQRAMSRPALTARGLDVGRAYIKITLHDNGIGFHQHDARRIFQTFARLNPKDQFEGTGLGLALCKKIAERHGGLIEAEGKAGEGAAFSVILPLDQVV